MKTYVVFVPGMKVTQLARFTQKVMLSLEDLLAEAKRQKVPEQCRTCGILLEEFVGQYATIPSEDLTITFARVGRYGAACDQTASGGNCNCRRIKARLRRIVQMHLAQKLREAGHYCSTHTY
ncbi:MAG: hypothetical protein KGZ30_00720 [Anaplasmataceae bacterium]|nr:hypothetical protein [Anaplasmataceae bacterium]